MRMRDHENAAGTHTAARHGEAPVAPHARVTLVVLSWNRCEELRRTLEHLHALPTPVPIIVVDNGSTDGTARMLRTRFPTVQHIHLPINIGAAARNTGARAASTPYVAFCDDDTWWEGDALDQAAALLDRYPRIAVLNARVVVGPERREDPTCTAMARSPLRGADLPGPRLVGFMAGAVVMRRAAFLAVGGYEKKLFIGAEEALLAMDLLSLGWDIVYASALTVVHWPSQLRDAHARNWLLLRNRVWVAWLRYPAGAALRETLALLREAQQAGRGFLLRVLRECLAGARWALSTRAPMPQRVWHMVCAVRRHPTDRDDLLPNNPNTRNATRESAPGPRSTARRGP